MKKMLSLKKTSLLLLIVSTLFTCKQSYTDQWEVFETDLILKEKSFQSYKDFVDSKNDFKLVNYISDDMQLTALLNTKHIDSTKKKPVIVYLHGGLCFGV